MSIFENEVTAQMTKNNSGWIVGKESGELLRIPAKGPFLASFSVNAAEEVILPNVYDHPGTVLALDLDGRLYKSTAVHRRDDLEQDVYVFDPCGLTGEESIHINPLDFLGLNDRDLWTDIKSMAEKLTDWIPEMDDRVRSHRTTPLKPSPLKQMASPLLMALILHVKISPDIEDKDRNLSTVFDLLDVNTGPEFMELMRKFSQDDSENAVSLKRVGNYFLGFSGESNTRDVIYAAQNSLSVIEDPNISAITQDTNIDLANLRHCKTTLFFVGTADTMDNKEAAVLLGLMINGALNSCPDLGDLSDYNDQDIEHDDRILFMLPQFDQLGLGDVYHQAENKGVNIWGLMLPGVRTRSLLENHGTEPLAKFIKNAGLTQFINTPIREEFGVSPRLCQEFAESRIAQKTLIEYRGDQGREEFVVDKVNYYTDILQSKMDGVHLDMPPFGM